MSPQGLAQNDPYLSLPSFYFLSALWFHCPSLHPYLFLTYTYKSNQVRAMPCESKWAWVMGTGFHALVIPIPYLGNRFSKGKAVFFIIRSYLVFSQFSDFFLNFPSFFFLFFMPLFGLSQPPFIPPFFAIFPDFFLIFPIFLPQTARERGEGGR
jgi:hypothetical protein